MYDDDLDEVLRLPAVKKATGMCTSEIYDGMVKKTFPQNFLLEDDGKAVGWWKREIVAYQKARKAAR